MFKVKSFLLTTLAGFIVLLVLSYLGWVAWMSISALSNVIKEHPLAGYLIIAAAIVSYVLGKLTFKVMEWFAKIKNS